MLSANGSEAFHYICDILNNLQLVIFNWELFSRRDLVAGQAPAFKISKFRIIALKHYRIGLNSTLRFIARPAAVSLLAAGRENQ
jgi:hypothetical protein